MNLQHIIDLTQQLHSVGVFRNLQTDFLQVFLDAELSAIVQLLPELAAIVCRDAQFLIDHNKKERHETVFPEDKKKAFALGEQMANGPWE